MLTKKEGKLVGMPPPPLPFRRPFVRRKQHFKHHTRYTSYHSSHICSHLIPPNFHSASIVWRRRLRQVEVIETYSGSPFLVTVAGYNASFANDEAYNDYGIAYNDRLEVKQYYRTAYCKMLQKQGDVLRTSLLLVPLSATGIIFAYPPMHMLVLPKCYVLLTLTLLNNSDYDKSLRPSLKKTQVRLSSFLKHSFWNTPKLTHCSTVSVAGYW